MTVSPSYASDASYRRPVQTGGSSTMYMVWAVYDFGLCLLALLAGTEGIGVLVPGSIAWLLVYALALFRIALQPAFFLGLLMRNATLLLFPAICIASTIWSVSPALTVVGSVQLTMTILIAIYIGSRFTPMQLCLWVFMVMCFVTLLSLANWKLHVFGPSMDDSGSLTGIFKQKNILGKAMFLGLISGVALLVATSFHAALKVFWVLPAMAAMALAMMLSKSVTSILTVPIFSALILALCFRKLHPGVILIAALGIVVVVGIAPLFFVLIGFDPISVVLKAFNKGTTLTGRTLLWGIAAHIINDYWLTGVGYSAFWDSPKFISYQFRGQQIGGENIKAFHNFILEIWVMVGIPGVLAMLTLLWAAISRAVKLWLGTLETGPAYAIAMTLGLVMTALLEPHLYRQHEVALLLVVALAVSCAETMRRAKA